MIYRGFGLFVPRALREIPRPGQNRKNTIPGARGPEIEKKVTTLSGMVVCNFFKVCVLTDRTPRGGKSQNTGFLGPFGLGQPLALGEIPGRKQNNAISRSSGHFWGGNPSAPKISPQNCATFLHFACCPTGPPGAGNRKIQGS